MLNVQENISLAPMTSFRIGGNARFYVEVHSAEELKEALNFAKEKNINFVIFNGGTNVLISDKGFDGLVVKTKLSEISVSREVLQVDAGVPLIKAVNTSALTGLSGIEALAGIPGNVGGAIRGNAGAFGSEISEHISEIKAFDCEKFEEISFGKESAQFGYRTSIFKKNKNLVILSATFVLKKGDAKEIKHKINETILKRVSGALHGAKSPGSYFTNPIVKDEKLREEFAKNTGAPAKNETLPAGWLIDRAGLCGKKMGGAMISENHGNYIINTGDATAENVIMLASYVKQQVRDQFGVQLNEEVSYIGF